MKNSYEKDDIDELLGFSVHPQKVMKQARKVNSDDMLINVNELKIKDSNMKTINGNMNGKMKSKNKKMQDKQVVGRKNVNQKVLQKMRMSSQIQNVAVKSNVGLWLFVALFLLFLASLSYVGAFFVSATSQTTAFGNVAVIPIRGAITIDSSQGLFAQSVVTSDEIVKMIERADSDPTIKVILLDINSPGGSPVATKEVVNALGRVNKSTYSFIREVGASGAYWIASASDKIIANEMSITGSIGVISSYLGFSGLMSDYNVSYERLVAGEYKDIGTPYKEMTNSERILLEKQLDLIHAIFVDEVAKNRGMTVEQLKPMANGMYYLGITAKEMGLIDEVGDIKLVESIIKSELGLEKVEYVTYRKSQSWLSLFSQVFSEQSFYVGRGIGAQLVEQQVSVSDFEIKV